MYAGNYWIYSTYDNFTTVPGEPTYCHPTLYWYAFWLTTAGYIILGVIFIGGCVGCCVFVCIAVRDDSSSKADSRPDQ